MIRFLTWAGYSLYFFVITAVFAYLLFPSQAVTQYVTAQAARRLPRNVELRMDRARPDVPLALTFYDIGLSRNDLPFLTVDRLKIIPTPKVLFTDAKTFHYNAWTCDGQIKGKATLVPLAGRGQRPVIDAQLTGIQIQKIDAVKQFPKYAVSGILSGTLNYDGSNGMGTGQANLKLANCQVGLAIPLIKLPQFHFQNIQVDLTLNPEGTLEIQHCDIKGKELNGQVTGNVKLNMPLEKSRLNLAATFQPHPSFLASMDKGILSLFFKRGPNQKEFRVRITGTLEKPVYSRS